MPRTRDSTTSSAALATMTSLCHATPLEQRLDSALRMRAHDPVLAMRRRVPRTNSATAAGTNVSDSTSAAVNAITTVIAIG